MTRQQAKEKAEKMFTYNGDKSLARILVNSIYDDFEKELNCENQKHEFTVSTKELCEILNYFKKNMLQ